MGWFIYFGIGFLLLAISQGGVINWESAWTFAILMAWPIVLIYWAIAGMISAGLWILIILVILLVLSGLSAAAAEGFGRFSDRLRRWRERRRDSR